MLAGLIGLSLWVRGGDSLAATLSYWQLDETTGAAVVKDSVGTNNLTAAVSVTQTQAFAALVPNPDQSLFTSGNAQTNPAALHNSHAGRSAYDAQFDMRDTPWTLEGWFRNSALTNIQVLAATRNSSAGYKGWDLSMNISGTLRVYGMADISGSSFSLTTGGRYDDGIWHHVALEWDPATGTKGWIQFYVDGTLMKEGPGVGDLGNTNSTRRFAIGTQLRTDGVVSSPWKGELDEFRFSTGLLAATNLLCATNTPLPPPGPEGVRVWSLSAACRKGQAFIQWSESTTNDQNLKVYIHTAPITPANFSQARLVEQRIEPHSANDWYEDVVESPMPADPPRGWILQDGGTAMNRTGGLFVHTVEASDPAQAFFAVLTDSQSGANLVAGQNALTSAVALAVSPISPIWQLGLTNANSPPAAGKPLALLLHSHMARPAGSSTYLMFGDKTMGWREGLPFKFNVSVLSSVVLVEPYDRVWINRKLGASETFDSYATLYKNIETMHYGTSDKIYDPALRYTGTVVNYTERLHLRVLDWVQQVYQTDTNRVYAYGASMGTGVLRLALQNPDRFASVDLLVPFVDWSYLNGTENNAKRLDAACGPMTMMTSEGLVLANRVNLVGVVQNTTRNLPHIIIRAGRMDGSVYWFRKPAFLAAMQTNRHGLIAGWDNGTHSTAMRTAGIPAFPNFCDYAYASSHFARNLSYPAFSRFSMNQNPGNGDKTEGDITGFINRGLEWSGIVDLGNRYAVKIQVTHPDVVYPVTVDVTPRNLQSFQLKPGQRLRGQNRNSAGTLLEEKTIIVDAAGRATYESFRIDSAQGNTLTITALDHASYILPPLGGAITNGIMVLKFSDIPGGSYALEWATNLAPPVNWLAVTTNTADLYGMVNFTGTSTAPLNLFRIRGP